MRDIYRDISEYQIGTELLYNNDALTAPLLYYGDDARLLTQEKNTVSYHDYQVVSDDTCEYFSAKYNLTREVLDENLWKFNGCEPLSA
jgi:hypothetical protein